MLAPVHEFRSSRGQEGPIAGALFTRYFFFSGPSDHGPGTLPGSKTLPSPSPTSGTSRSEWHAPTAGFLQKHRSKILLVEDEELVRELLARILSDAGYAVEQADNGASGLQAARRLDGSLSLVITDIRMPVMDGFELARNLRATDREVPFLFITGTDPALINDFWPAKLLAKPFTPDAILDTVARMLTGATTPGGTQLA